MDRRGWLRRSLVRVVNDDNLDLYLLGTVALVFTVLGITGVSDVKTTMAAVVALLALLAFSQIRSRRLFEQIRAERQSGPAALFSWKVSAELIARRAQAHDMVLVGYAMDRTVQNMRSDMLGILAAGGRIRVLVLDPTDDVLIETAVRRLDHSHGPDKVRARIMMTLEELTTLRDRTGGRLEIRVSSAIPSAGITGLDLGTQRGLVCLWHYEYQPRGETAPVFVLERSEGAWYQHFVDETERLWNAGTEWPLSTEDAAARARRPVFSDTFGPELDAAIDETDELFVTGTARNSLINGNFDRLRKKLLAGSRIRFVLVDPNGPAIATAADRYYAERSPDAVRDRVEHSLRLLAELRTSTGGDLSVRLIPHALTVIVIATEAALFAEYFPYQQPGTPKFVLPSGDADHKRFLAEAEALWRNAKPHDL